MPDERLMGALADLFDSYSRRARLSPALLVVMPVLLYLLPQLPALSALSGQPGWVGLLWPLLLAAGVPFLLTTVVRSSGKATQRRLLSAWDGFSSTRVLRHRDPGSPHRREHRRRRLEELLATQLPTAAEEARDPAGADELYQLAVEQLIARVRAQASSFPLVAEENAHYGFRRNMLGIKPLASGVLGACLVVDLVLLIGAAPSGSGALPPEGPLMGLVLAAHAGMLLGWLVQVRPPWVREAADDYTARLYAALDDPRL